MAAPLDYRLALYSRIWSLLLASQAIATAFKPANRVRFDDKAQLREFVRAKHAPADFPKLAVFYGSGSDSGWSPRYANAYDAGQAVDVQQSFRVRLTFEKPDLALASPIIAEARAAILRAGPRLGGSVAGLGYVKLSGASDSTCTIGPDPETAGSNSTAERLTAEFSVAVQCVLTMGQLTGA